MYEGVTYEGILKRLMERIPSDIDKREGSIIYYALAPAAAELQIMYIELDTVLNEMFADTAGREYLVRRAAERGISPKPASHAVLKGIFNIEIPIGSRFSLDMLNYTAVARTGIGEYRMQCETIGKVGNSRFGTMLPISYIPGLTRADLTELLIPGEDEEETEVFRRRYFDSLNSQAFGGNIADYKEKVSSIAGIGGVKVYPAWNGGGTVKLVIVSSEYTSPSEELIRSVRELIDPEEASGNGYGLAPIGHKVTVGGAGEQVISLHSNLTYQAGYSFEHCREEILSAVDEYLKELNQSWSDMDRLVVRVSRLESRLLDITGILDVADTTINGSGSNYELPLDSLAVRGDVFG